MIHKPSQHMAEDNSHTIELEDLDKYNHKTQPKSLLNTAIGLNIFDSQNKTPESIRTPYILVWQFVFLFTGVLTTLVSQWMFYKNATDKSSLITITARFFGMVLVQFTSFKNPKVIKSAAANQAPKGQIKRSIWMLTLIDFSGDILLTIGLFSIGSGIFQVLVSLLIPTTALLSKVFLNKKHSALQWWGILCIMVGLAATAMGKIEQDDVEPLKFHHLIIGGSISIAGILLYSVLYVLTERTMNLPTAPNANRLCYTMGQYGSMLCIGYQILYLIPSRWNIIQTTISNPTENESILSIFIFGFIILMISALFHNLSYFLLMDTTGAVSIGVLLALKTVAVFIMSGFLFCGTDPDQCLNPAKFTSLIIVVLGVLIFTLSKVTHK